LTFVLAAFFFFRRLEGVLSLVLLCVGDGFASLLGVNFGSLLGPLPWNRKKSWVGTLSFVLISIPVVFWYSSLGVYWQWWDEAASRESRVAIIASTLVAAAVESSTLVGRHDNIAIFVVSLLTMYAWPKSY
jgi:dolichol kinase